MDGTRCRRLKDTARQAWYGRWRNYRFARHMGMPLPMTGSNGAVASLLSKPPRVRGS